MPATSSRPSSPRPTSFFSSWPRASFTAGVGLVFGLPSLRIKGFYLAVATLAAQFFLDWCFNRVAWLYNYNASGAIEVPARDAFGIVLTGPDRHAGRPLLRRALPRGPAHLGRRQPRPRPDRPVLDDGPRHGHRGRAHGHPPPAHEAPGVRRLLLLRGRGRCAHGLLLAGCCRGLQLLDQPLVPDPVHGHHRRARQPDRLLRRCGLHLDPAGHHPRRTDSSGCADRGRDASSSSPSCSWAPSSSSSSSSSRTASPACGRSRSRSCAAGRSRTARRGPTRRVSGRSTMPLKGLLAGAALVLTATAALPALAEDALYVPLMTYRTGAYRRLRHPDRRRHARLSGHAERARRRHWRGEDRDRGVRDRLRRAEGRRVLREHQEQEALDATTPGRPASRSRSSPRPPSTDPRPLHGLRPLGRCRGRAASPGSSTRR